MTWRKPTGRPAPSYEDAITEALRFGWIDSVARRFDDQRTMLRFTPRKPRSGGHARKWSASPAWRPRVG